MKEPKLTDLIDVSVLQKLQNGFSKYTGLAALTTDENGIPVTVGSGFSDLCMNLVRKTEKGCRRCEECDRQGALMTLKNGKASVYYCHTGLMDFAAPIMLEGRLIGSFIGGQVRTTPFNADEVKKAARELDIDENTYLVAAKKVNVMTHEEVEMAAEFLTELAGALSEMAYNSYKALNESRKLERIAKSQTAFMIDLNTEIQKNMHDWIDVARNALDGKNSDLMENTLTDMIEKGREFLLSVDDTVEYAKLSKGELELNETVYNIRELFELIVNIVKENPECCYAQFNVIFEDTVPDNLMGDTGRIGQVITKLLLYCADIADGNVSVRVSCKEKSYATQLKILINADGKGLDKESLDDVRNCIKNGNLRLSETNEGDFLGLSIIGFLLRQMSGNMEITSDIHEGTLFTIYLPQLKVDAL
ncbi:MAG: PocR ligand-binding domain-containing protein [Lachnospiraceae bacterium]